jgi:hypothetical protein
MTCTRIHGLNLLTNRRSIQVQTQIFIERKLKHDAHNMKHNIKNSSRFLSHEIQKLVQGRKENQTINTKVFNEKTKP